MAGKTQIGTRAITKKMFGTREITKEVVNGVVVYEKASDKVTITFMNNADQDLTIYSGLYANKTDIGQCADTASFEVDKDSYIGFIVYNTFPSVDTILQQVETGSPDLFEHYFTYIASQTATIDQYGSSCFDAGTQVLMSDNSSKNIEDIKVGEYVMSYDEATKKLVPQVVENTIIRHNSTDLIYIYLSDGTKIGMTREHPILTPNGWASLNPNFAVDTNTEKALHEKPIQLNIGDDIIGANGIVKLEKVETREHIANYDTYTLDVETIDNYVVNGIVVHNVH